MNSSFARYVSAPAQAANPDAYASAPNVVIATAQGGEQVDLFHAGPQAIYTPRRSDTRDRLIAAAPSPSKPGEQRSASGKLTPTPIFRSFSSGTRPRANVTTGLPIYHSTKGFS